MSDTYERIRPTKIGVVRGVISSQESESEESDSTNDSVTCDLVKTSLSESGAEAEKPANYSASSQLL